MICDAWPRGGPIPHVTTHIGQAFGTLLIGSRAVVAIKCHMLDVTDTSRHVLVGRPDVLGRDIFTVCVHTLLLLLLLCFAEGTFPW